MRARIVLTALVAALAAAPAAHAAFPGKNGLIAFQKSKNGRSDIWVIGAKGGKERDLTKTPAIFETAPSFSPNGRTIAFYWLSSESTRAGQKNGIGIVNSDGTRLRTLTSGNMASDFYERPAWTADGKNIVYTRSHNDANGEPVNATWTVSAHGGAQRQITPDHTLDAITSPIGRQLVYLEFNPAGDDFLKLTDASGANPVTIGGPPNMTDFSPDGQRLVYDHESKILVRSISPGATPTQVADEGANDLDPAFSPDGRFLVWSNEGTHDLWVANSNGGGARNLTHQPGFEKDPSWGRAAKSKRKHH